MSTIESAYRKPASKGQSIRWSRSVQSARSPDARGRARAIGAALLTLALSTTGCHSIYLPAFMAPYRPDVQQGNVITRDMVEQLRPGMTRDQVKFMLGTPLLTDGFHPDRWDYLYYLNPRKGAPQRRNLVVYFKDNRLDHFTSDPMPPESMADNLILGQKPYGQPSAAPKEPVPAATAPAPAKESAPETTSPASTNEAAPEAKPPASTQ
jgi:outer membrane protein assembly factor BamE